MATRLLNSRRFLPLFLTQALGALNDNVFKNAFVVLVIFQATKGGPLLVALAGALFILPYALLSSLAGELADRFDKSRLIRLTKLFECALMLVGALGLATGSVALMMAVLLGLGVQATFFGPLKYGILPDHLAATELVRGNALIEAGTFGAILVGTIAGGVLVGLPHGEAVVGGAGLAIALAGLAAAWAVPAAPAAAPGLRIRANILAGTAALLRDARQDRAVWLAILGLSWFWALGAVFLAEFPVLAQRHFGADNQVVTLMLACFAVGVGIGSMLAGRLLRGRVSAAPVPAAALALSVCALGFAAAIWGVLPADGWTGIAAIAAHPRAILAMALLMGTAAAGGVFSVPLYAVIQHRAAPGWRARMIAANNVMNAVLMVAGSAVLAGLSALGVSPAAVFAIAGVLNLIVAAWACVLLPGTLLRGAVRAFFSRCYGVDVSGLQHVPPEGTRLVIVCNHLSFLDGAFLAAFLPGNPVFAVDTTIARSWWARIALAPVEVLTVDPTNPYAIRDMVRVVKEGRPLVIFPEGRITQTGGLMKIYDGAALVAEKANAQVLPVRIDGLQFTPFSRMGGKLRRRWFPRLALTVRPPVRLHVNGALAGRPMRRALGERLRQEMVMGQFQATPTGHSLFAALLRTAGRHGAASLAVEDPTGVRLSYKRLILGAVVLGGKLAGMTRPGERVGLLLPNAAGAVVTFFALQAHGRVPAMLNPTAGAQGLRAACTAAGITRIVTARRFIEKAKLQAVIEELGASIAITWLEDVRAGIGTGDKLRGLLRARRAATLPGAMLDADAPAVVLFTSGSEGTPKGVVLSHRNILANCAQLAAVVDFSPADRVLNAMPMFHAFGLTGGTLLPLLHGVPGMLYPSPLHYRVVPELAYACDATITFGTDTFLAGWARNAHAYDFRSLRLVFSGAEAVREDTRRLYADRFGVRILEGYGATETAPVLALNTPMNNRPGSAGQMLPGMEWMLEKVAGIEAGGRLHVRGPNVMLGYLRAEQPGVLQPPAGGWYDTGDIVRMEGVGQVFIQGRAKRFAKIAGEMVSMAVAETLAAALWPDAAHAVVALPDAGRGERLLLLTTQADAGTSALGAEARRRGVPAIAVPGSLTVIEKMPLLATGKVDYPAVQALALAPRAAAA